MGERSRFDLGKCMVLVLALLPSAACGPQRHEMRLRPPELLAPPHEGVLHDPPANSVPDEVTGGIFNVRVNQDSSGQPQLETTVAVDPLDPLHIVAGAIDARSGAYKGGYYISTDGGHTWTDGVLATPPGLNLYDPIVTFCPNGNAFFLGVEAPVPASGQPHQLVIYDRPSGSTAWNGPRKVVSTAGTPLLDKPWMACDTTGGPFSGRLYVSWTDFIGINDRPIYLRYSTDQGMTWSRTVNVSESHATNSSYIAIGPDGSVNMTWNHVEGAVSQLGFDRSTDGGVTFGTDRVPTNIVGDVTPEYRYVPFLVADRSGGPFDGSLYLVWPDGRYGDGDILCIRSRDYGQTWSAPVRVNDDAVDNGASQFMPMVDVDPSGHLIIAFYDRRRYIGLDQYEVWGAISRDGGVSFDTNFLIGETVSIQGFPTEFLGDYSSGVATPDTFVPIWVDRRLGDLDLFTEPYPNVFDYDEVRNVRWTSKTAMAFDTQDARFGEDLAYDVASGMLSELQQDAGYSSVTCVAPLWPDSPFVELGVPPAGDAYYYLVRTHGPAGVGTHGDGAPPQRPNVRDVLDEQPPCP